MEDTKDKTLWPGWETVRLIGEGSFGAVYEIQRDVFGSTENAALKVISIPQSKSDINDLLVDGYDVKSITSRFREYLQDIVREYSMMAKMKGCANIVYCDDVKYIQQENGIGWNIYIKMELLTPMTDVMGKEYSEEQAIKLGRDMCSALVFCEERNVIHRDIKPQNIFIAPDGTYKLGDFGVAKTAERTTSGTKTGTYKYMAPEVYNNQPYGARADIYSLGLVLYWMLNDRRTPFLPLPPAVPSATDDTAARTRRMSGEAIPEPAHGSSELKRIVMKACAYDPEERYHNAREMQDDLNQLAAASQSFVPEPGGGHFIPVPNRDEDGGQDPGDYGKGVSPEEKTSVIPDRRTKSDRGSGKKLALILVPIVAAAAVLGVVLSGVFRNSRDTSEETAVVEGVSMAETAIEMEEGATYQLKARVSPTNEVNTGVKWLSADPGVAAVSEDGIVTAVKAGKTIIVATTDVGGYSCTCEITVSALVREITLNEEALELGPDETYQLAVNEGDAVGIRWSSSAPEVASVSETGLVTALDVGSAEITATTADGQASAVCSVTVCRKVTGVKFVLATRMLRRGRYYTLEVQITPEDATNKNLIWSSSNTKVAVITSDGRIKTVGYGGATITVTTEDGGFTAECKIVVNPQHNTGTTDPDDPDNPDDPGNPDEPTGP